MPHGPSLPYGFQLVVAAIVYGLLSASALACDLPEAQKGTVSEGEGRRDPRSDRWQRLINAEAPVTPLAWRRHPMADGQRGQGRAIAACVSRGGRAPLRGYTDRPRRYALAQVYVVKGGERVW